jgi:hypothetical protein
MASNLLCRQVHGFNRGGELREAIDARTARVVEQKMGRITGYAGEVAFFAHAVAGTTKASRQ